MRRVAVKVCGVTRASDAEAVAAAGADYVGVILSEGFSRSISIAAARGVADAAGLPLVAVLVDPSLEDAVARAGAAGASVIQLHGSESPRLVARLRERGRWKVWKAARVREAGEAEGLLARYGGVADGLLVDGWHPELRGGAGVRFPWTRVRPVREAFPPGLIFVAAGGLTPENVGEAVRILDPEVVDVSSGVEVRTGVKDHERVARFVRAARGGGGAEGAAL